MLDIGKLNLPEGYEVVREPDGDINMVISIDPDIVYPNILDELEVDKSDINQYWVEVAYQIAKMDAQRAVISAGGDFGFTINILSRPEWKLERFQPGDGVEAATKGHGARHHYIRLRGAIPVVVW